MVFLGLDVGGSQCRFEWWPVGAAAGGDGASVQPAVQGVEATVAGLDRVLRTAMQAAKPEAVVCALAGVGEAKTRDAILVGLRARGLAVPIAVVGDIVAAAAAGLREGPGVLLWSGTGSFVIARGADGELHRVGGRGYLLGDQGSAYDFVRRAAAAVLMAVDGLGPPTALTATLTAAFAAPSPQRLGAVLQGLRPGEVAAQLGVVLAAAEGGDAVALEVVQQGVDGLVMLANAAVRQAGLDWREVPVAFGGGVVTHAPTIAELLAQRLQTFGAGAPQRVAPRAAAVGAAWLAQGWHHRRQPQTSWVERVTL